MPWSGSTFIRDNSVFTGSLVWTDDRDAGTKITAAHHDYHDQDIANGITQCLRNDGGNSFTASIDAAGFKITGAGAGSASTDYATYGQTITAASLNAGTNVLTLTRSTGGDVTVDLSALAVGGSTTDFARYSNALNPFQGSAYFAGAAGVGLKNLLTILDPVTTGGATYTWGLAALTPTLSQYANTAGATFSFSGNSGAATFKVNNSKVWTEATLTPATVAGILSAGTSATITAPWAFTQTMGLPSTATWSTATAGETWFQQQSGGNFIQWSGSSGGATFGFLGGTSTTGGGDILVNGNRVWNMANMAIRSTTPSGGNDGDVALVISGADKGVWVKDSGVWGKIAS